jgi:hypothetical protein
VAAVSKIRISILYQIDFTIYAPTDAAFIAAGFPNVAAVSAADPTFYKRFC